MAFTTKTDTPIIIDEWPYKFQHIDDTDPLYDFLTPFAQEYRQIDVFIDELYEQRFIETATNEELEKIAAGVGIHRRDSEDDDSLRFRTRLRYIAAASDGTAEDILVFMEVSFEDKDLGNINITHDPGHPVLYFEMPQVFIDDIPLTRLEYESELRRAWPVGHDIRVLTSDVWLLGHSGSQGIGNGGLI